MIKFKDSSITSPQKCWLLELSRSTEDYTSVLVTPFLEEINFKNAMYGSYYNKLSYWGAKNQKCDYKAIFYYW